MDIKKFNADDFTHWLLCRHCVSARSCTEYEMKCILVKRTVSGKAKIIVFGDRNWKDKDHIKRVRYVDFNKIIERKTHEDR